MQFNKIHNEDCFNTMAKMPDNSVDLVVTSPPWNAKKNYGNYSDDNKPDYETWLCRLCFEIERITSNAAYIFMSQEHMFTLKDSLKHFKQWLFYHRKNFGTASYLRSPWMKTITPVAMSMVDKDMHMDAYMSGIKSVDLLVGVNPQSDYIKNKRLHPAQDPIEAYLPLVARTPCNLVYDPFMGSGTLAVCAVKLGKKWIGSEINSEYVAMANKRISTAKQQTELFIQQETLDV